MIRKFVVAVLRWRLARWRLRRCRNLRRGFGTTKCRLCADAGIARLRRPGRSCRADCRRYSHYGARRRWPERIAVSGHRRKRSDVRIFSSILSESAAATAAAPGSAATCASRDVPRGLGSGFILSPDGYVMTNAHVVRGADDIIVTTSDRREFKAKLIGADTRTDVALIKIEATGLPAVRMGDPNKLRVGEWVIAIGSPFGLENTVTAGIVSAKSRDTGDFLPFIQTDVAVNPGNSGGPLINMRGEVVGINSQIFTTSGAYNGISFAIPIDEANNVQQQLRASGRVIRGRIGVGIEAVSREVATAIGLAKPQGAVVTSVDKDGPAQKAGVEPGDVILRFDGRPIERASDLPRVVGNTKPGSAVNMTVFRKGSQRELPITVVELPAERVASARGPDAPKPGAAANVLGVAVSDVPPSG